MMTIEEQKQYNAALVFATEKHAGQKRLGGEPYITHPVAVAEMVKERGYGMEYLITSLFHDLLEDTDATRTEIEAIGGARVLEAVIRLTKTKGYVMQEYVAGIRKDPIAFVVKGADRLHNLRSAFCTSEAFRRKYIQESKEWYMDFMPEIPEAVAILEGSFINKAYADIMALPHPDSKVHPRMNMRNRAAQFAPFAALTGYEDAIDEAGRLTERRAELDQDAKEVLDRKLRLVQEHCTERPEITVHYFEPDSKKEGGSYLTFCGVLKEADRVDRVLCFEDGTRIRLDHIRDIQGAVLAVSEN